MLKVIKIRIYPDSSQKLALAKAFGSCRWLWNHFLNLMNETYKQTGKGLSGYDVKKLIPELKKQEETSWLSETYSQCLQQVCLNLGVAFNNFFEKRAKYPNFKSKHGKQSLQYPSNVSIKGDCLNVPKIGLVYAKIHRPIDGKIKTVTITKNCCNQYYASVLVDDGKDKPKVSSEGKAIGIDLGLNHFAITSDGSKFDNPKILKKHEVNLKRKQQQLSRKQKGSNNRNKARLKVAKVHKKITNCREDFLHKLSRRIVNENQVIVLEDLNVKGMIKNHCLAKAIQQVGWGQFCTMLKYKAEQEGKTYMEVDRFFPSSKTCHVCLKRVDSLPLDIRHWECPKCKTKHDRDINAAINIRDEGLRILKTGLTRSGNKFRTQPLTSGTGDKAYCPDVRRGRGGRKKSTTPLSVG
ncbi:RNA-guided endonuclease InsQ/TnpB family protein [Cyanobacterium aponinum]|uniref:Transposase, IS605 OrfB family n=1 Tax=Cyanobacterium aponinum (strain PCC 10605) TaxID=755178 RepID=K9Z737_CYAAP|nr:RNA-guided endonuclease TnpB family protein [Cyanobacterium aponinum]AFZ53041.1 transposase, IS605 OrfB family [Cyanobacterium aponinum PCC 10605]AFZ54959.1 transposase, IS605 OrfB family [Cyanobacterium aponinum PCC 10605]